MPGNTRVDDVTNWNNSREVFLQWMQQNVLDKNQVTGTIPLRKGKRKPESRITSDTSSDPSIVCEDEGGCFMSQMKLDTAQTFPKFFAEMYNRLLVIHGPIAEHFTKESLYIMSKGTFTNIERAYVDAV